MTKCDLCGQSVKIVGDTTKHYEGLEFENGLKEAVIEIQGWRELVINAHNENPCLNPQEHIRETKNQLNLLGVIESKLRLKSGEDSKDIFKSMKERSKKELLLEI